MRSRWQIDELEHIEWSIGDGWFDADPTEFPNLRAASRESPQAFLGGLREFVDGAEGMVRCAARVDGLVVEVDAAALRVRGTWSELVLIEKERSFSFIETPPVERIVSRSPLDSLRQPTRPVIGSLNGSEGAALLARDAEQLSLVRWSADALVIHRVDGDLTWSHGETTPGGIWWRAVFRPLP